MPMEIPINVKLTGWDAIYFNLVKEKIGVKANSEVIRYMINEFRKNLVDLRFSGEITLGILGCIKLEPRTTEELIKIYHYEAEATHERIYEQLMAWVEDLDLIEYNEEKDLWSWKTNNKGDLDEM